MREIIFRRTQHDLDVARDLDLAYVRAAIRNPQPSHLDVVFRRHRDLE